MYQSDCFWSYIDNKKLSPKEIQAAFLYAYNNMDKFQICNDNVEKLSQLLEKNKFQNSIKVSGSFENNQSNSQNSNPPKSFSRASRNTSDDGR